MQEVMGLRIGGVGGGWDGVGGWGVDAVVSQETHPKVDHQPKSGRTRCLIIVIKFTNAILNINVLIIAMIIVMHPHHHKTVICTLQTLNRNACDINVGDAQAWDRHGGCSRS